jgi:hypothetical protein
MERIPTTGSIAGLGIRTGHRPTWEIDSRPPAVFHWRRPRNLRTTWPCGGVRPIIANIHAGRDTLFTKRLHDSQGDC